MHAGRDVVRQPIHDRAVGGEGALERLLGRVGAHHLLELRVQQQRISGIIELHIGGAGVDRGIDLPAQDLAEVRRHLTEVCVVAVGDARLEHLRVGDRRRRWERDLDRRVRERRRKTRLLGPGVADDLEALGDDRTALELNATLVVVEDDGVVRRLEAPDRLVERPHEERAPELAVGDRPDADLLLLGHDGPDLVLGDLPDRVLVGLRKGEAEVSGMDLAHRDPGLRLDRPQQRCRPQKAPDMVGTGVQLAHGLSWSSCR